MARPRLSICLLAMSALLLAAPPALAQFGSIFSDFPPRPPANVPSAPPSPPPANFPSQPPGNFPQRRCAAPAGRHPFRSAAGAAAAGADEPAAVKPPRWRHHPVAAAAAAARRTGGAAAAAASAAAARRRPVRGRRFRAPPGVRQPRGRRQPADTAPQPGDEIVVEPPPQRITNPTAVFSGLDKITGRIISFDVAINETVQFGALQVTPRVCYSRPPTETPNTDAFVEVDEVTLQGEIKRIFTGWMFAASPGLHAVEHPIYDVWITDCKGGQNPNVAEAPAAPPPAPKQPVRPAAAEAPAAARAAAGMLPGIR